MKSLKPFDIKFVGLNNGTHRFQYHIEQDFLEHYQYDESEKCNVEVEVEMKKSDNLLEFSIHSKGKIDVPCDISNEIYSQPIEQKQNFIVKFGEKYDDTQDDLITIPYNEHKFNIAQQIYENIILGIPMKKIHPDLISGKMKTKNTDYIINADDYHQEEKKEIDPRWEELKKLLTDKKK